MYDTSWTLRILTQRMSVSHPFLWNLVACQRQECHHWCRHRRRWRLVTRQVDREMSLPNSLFLIFCVCAAISTSGMHNTNNR